MKKLITLFMALTFTVFARGQCPTNVDCDSTTFVLNYSPPMPTDCDSVYLTVNGVVRHLAVVSRDASAKTITIQRDTLNCSDIATITQYIRNGSIVGTTCSSQVALPVYWIKFSIAIEDNIVRIQFLVNEERNSHFIVQRFDVDKWTTIEKINSKTGSGLNSYTIVDFEPNSGFNFYRIIQVDLDGKTSESPYIKAVTPITVVGEKEKYDILGRKVNKGTYIKTY